MAILRHLQHWYEELQLDAVLEPWKLNWLDFEENCIEIGQTSRHSWRQWHNWFVMYASDENSWTSAEQNVVNQGHELSQKRILECVKPCDQKQAYATWTL